MFMHGTYTPSTESDPYLANVVWLTNFEGNAAKDLVSGTTMTTGGTVSIGTTIVKNGSYSATMTGGAGGWWLPDGSTTTSSVNSSFTLEFWFYQASADSASYSAQRGAIFCADHYWSNNQGWRFYARGSGVSGALNQCVFILGTAIVMQTTGQNTDWSYNAWHHMAVSRSGSSFAMWIDGTRVATGTSSATVTVQYPSIGKGSHSGSTDACFKGYMDDFRWTNVARYDPSLTTITVPTAPFSLS